MTNPQSQKPLGKLPAPYDIENKRGLVRGELFIEAYETQRQALNAAIDRINELEAELARHCDMIAAVENRTATTEANYEGHEHHIGTDQANVVQRTTPPRKGYSV